MLLCAIANISAGEPDGYRELAEEKGRLRYEMAKVRIQLLDENAEFKELNQRITKLQKVLIKKLHAHPKMAELIRQLEEVEGKLTE